MDDILLHTREILTTTPARWLHLTAAVSPELLARRPGPHDWSALECLQHLVDTEVQVFSARLRAFLNGQPIEDFDPDLAGMAPRPQQTPDLIAEKLRELRETSLAALAALPADALGRSTRHAELGVVTLGQMLHQWPAHDLMHTVQAERALMQPLIQGAGPWQPFFSDHVATGQP